MHRGALQFALAPRTPVGQLRQRDEYVSVRATRLLVVHHGVEGGRVVENDWTLTMFNTNIALGREHGGFSVLFSVCVRGHKPFHACVPYVSAAYGPLFYTHRSGAMSGSHVGDAAVTAGGGDRSPVEIKSVTSIAKQHSYEQIDHAHYLANDIGTLYLNDRLDYQH